MSTDAVIMLRRNFKHTTRDPITVFNAVLLPVVIMLMFVYILGIAFNVGVKYIDYAVPGMILLAITYGLGATATAVNSDMTTGIINRFGVMDVSRGAVLTGHFVVIMLRSLIAIAAIVGVAFALGFRSSASLPGWLAVVGVIVAASFAASWLAVALHALLDAANFAYDARRNNIWVETAGPAMPAFPRAWSVHARQVVPVRGIWEFRAGYSRDNFHLPVQYSYSKGAFRDTATTQGGLLYYGISDDHGRVYGGRPDNPSGAYLPSAGGHQVTDSEANGGGRNRVWVLRQQPGLLHPLQLRRPGNPRVALGRI